MSFAEDNVMKPWFESLVICGMHSLPLADPNRSAADFPAESGDLVVDD